MRQVRRAFTLFELLIVIMIMALVVYFVFSTPSIPKEKSVRVTYKNFSDILQSSLKGDGELVCVNNCSKCFYLNGSASVKPSSLPLKLKVVNEYILDKNDNTVKINRGRYNDKKVCLRLFHYSNNSISQVILELANGKYIFVPSYFGEGKEFDNLNDATSWWIKDSQNQLQSKGEWY